jgi:hypothetical protein
MAKTYSTDATNPAPLTANESVNITQGAKLLLTIAADGTGAAEAQAWGEAGIGYFQVTEGTFRVENYSTSIGLKVPFTTNPPSSGNNGLVRFEFQGAFIDIGTGTGLANQTAMHWDSEAEWCACVWVETGSGTGVFEKYLNLAPHPGVTRHANGTFSKVGSGRLGKFFHQGMGNVATTVGSPTVTAADGTVSQFTKLTPGDSIQIANVRYTILSIQSDSSLTLTTNATVANTAATWSTSTLFFGDGTYGKAPPSGARIRVPNIIIGNKAALNTVHSISTQYCTLYSDTVQWSRVKFGAGSGMRAMEVYRNAIPGGLAWGRGYSALFEDCGFAPASDTTTSTILNNGASAELSGFVFRNCAVLGYQASSTAAPVYFQGCSTTWEDCEIHTLGTNNYPLNVDINCVTRVIRCLFTGHGLYVQGDVYSEDCEHIAFLGLTEVTGQKTAYTIPVGTMSRLEIVRPVVPVGGGIDWFINISSGTLNNLTIKGARIYSTYLSYLVYSASTLVHSNFNISDCYVASFRSGGGWASAGSYLSVRGAKWRNLRVGGGAFPNNLSSFSAYMKMLDIRSMSVQNNPASGTSNQAIDAFFYSIQTGVGTGAFGHSQSMVTANSPFVTLTGSATVNGGILYLQKLGDSITIEVPYKVLGHSSFTAVTPPTGIPNIAIEYAIDTGSGWSEWKDAKTMTFLSQEVIDPEAGFRFKLRYVTLVASVNNKISVPWSVNTTFDDTVMYPESNVNVTLRNLVPGSRYLVVDSDTGESYGSGVADNSGIVTISGIPYFYDFGIKVKVRSASSGTKYQPFQTQAQVTANGADVWVAQVEDTVASAAI